jgi:hypothetical protein
MDKSNIVTKLQSVSEYLKATKIPVGETDAIKRILGCVSILEKLAVEIQNSETDNKDEEQVVKKNG